MAHTSVFSIGASPDYSLLRNFCGLRSPVGRGIPDVSAQALNYHIIKLDEEYTVSGTSCSVPVCSPPPSTVSFLLRHFVDSQCTDRGGDYLTA